MITFDKNNITNNSKKHIARNIAQYQKNTNGTV